MRFKDIHGLENTKELLRSAVSNNHVAHAQLFAGKPGAPALPMALAFASYLNCNNPTGGDACGTCPQCSKNQKFIHPDVHFVFPVSATKQVPAKDLDSRKFLKEWRQFLLTSPYGNLNDWSELFSGEGKQPYISTREKSNIVQSLSLKTFEGKYKIMIIWHPELMHRNAANGILKVLEEPPENTVFILVSEQPDLLLTTIKSRVQRFTIPAFSDSELYEVLVSAHGIEPQRAKQVAHLADGSLRQALYLAANVEHNNFEPFSNWMRQCFKQQWNDIIEGAETFAKMNKTSQQIYLQYGLSLIREALIASSAALPNLFRVEGDEKTFATNLGKSIGISQFQQLSGLISEAIYYLERNANAKLLFTNLSIHISKIFSSK